MGRNVIVKLLPFKLPSDKRSGSYNAKHIEYVGSRPGTDKTITADSYAYQNTAIAIYNISSDDKYLAYIGMRPGVVIQGEHGVHPTKDHGLFGEYGVPDMAQVMGEIKTLDRSPMYRLVISLQESTAGELGFDTKDKWETLIRSQTNDVADGLKIPAQDMGWVAALHLKDGHPHVHMVCWDRKDRTRDHGRVVIPKENLSHIRASFTKAIYAERRLELYAAKNASRDILTKMAKDDTELVREFLSKPDTERNTVSMPAPSIGSIKKLSTAIKELSDMMPNHGRTGYAFMPSEVKEKVDVIVAMMLANPVYRNKLHDVTKVVRELTEQFTLNLDKIESAEHQAEADIGKRIAQRILSTAANLKQDSVRAEIHSVITHLLVLNKPINIGAGDTVRMFECMAAASIDRVIALDICKKIVPKHLYAAMSAAPGEAVASAEQLIERAFATPISKVDIAGWERITDKLSAAEERILANQGRAEAQAVATATVGLLRSAFAFLQSPKSRNPLHHFFDKAHTNIDKKRRDSLYTRDELE